MRDTGSGCFVVYYNNFSKQWKTRTENETHETGANPTYYNHASSSSSAVTFPEYLWK